MDTLSKLLEVFGGAGVQYIRDLLPGGLLSPELTSGNARQAAEVAAFEPGLLGSAASLGLAADDLRQGNYGSAAMNAVGLLPFVPAMGLATNSPKNIYKWRDKFWDEVKAGNPQKQDPALYRAMSADEYAALEKQGQLTPRNPFEPGIYVTDDVDRLTAGGVGSYGAKNGGVIVQLKNGKTIKMPSRTLNFDETALPSINKDDVIAVWDAASGELIK